LNHRIVKIDMSTTPATVSTYAGSLTAASGYADGVGTAARFARPWSLAIDATGTVYVSDTDNHAIRKITPDRRVPTLENASVAPPDLLLDTVSFDLLRILFLKDGPFGVATLIGPQGLQLDSQGRLIVAEQYLRTIRRIDLQARRVDLLASFP